MFRVQFLVSPLITVYQVSTASKPIILTVFCGAWFIEYGNLVCWSPWLLGVHLFGANNSLCLVLVGVSMDFEFFAWVRCLCRFSPTYSSYSSFCCSLEHTWSSYLGKKLVFFFVSSRLTQWSLCYYDFTSWIMKLDFLFPFLCF